MSKNLVVFQTWKSQLLTLLRQVRQLLREFLKNLRVLLKYLKNRPKREVADQPVLKIKLHDGGKSWKNPL